jgi:hypothetical protein
MLLRIITITIFIVSTITSYGNGYPVASDRAHRWQLRFDTGDLRFYRDQDTGDGYWLLVYEVTNETKEDHRWIPQFDLVTDKGEIIPDGDNVPRRVQLAVLDMFGDPLLESQSNASGPLLQGKDHAIRAFAMWKAGEEEVRQVQIFAGGVSGDTAEVINPKTGEEEKLHRVLQLSWAVQGDVDKLVLKPLTRRPLDDGTSVRQLSNRESSWALYSDSTGTRKWIFR